ncbi:MAG: hypothetical protein HRU70_01575 [Phycisphaeraceae bacterium]|nr:MAG: hypothetical protein HRU70_01575 [Phycisphaeraceae bacterium]
MSTTDANNDVAKLQAALKAERDAHTETKRAHGEFRTAILTPLGLPDNAPAETITARIGDVEKTITDRTAALTTERDEARTRLADVEGRWAGEKVDRSISDALSRSGMIADNATDALALARPLFVLSEKGEVVTKADAAGVIPGATPDQWIIAQLRTLRPHWWPKSAGGGASGGSRGGMAMGDDSCFRPESWNVTLQARYEKLHGTRAAEAAARRYGTTPFGLGR